MVAVGKTPSKLARDIEAVLAAYIRTPQVNVIVTNAVSTFSQVRVLGQVTTPQAVPYREGMTVLDAILAVGGLAEFAAGNRGQDRAGRRAASRRKSGYASTTWSMTATSARTCR